MTMRIGVVFPGQGSQVVGMGVDVARSSPAAAQCFAAAKTILGYDLLALCESGPEERLRETRYAQPAIFVTNVALARAVGEALEPVVGAGHSFGELCALTLAGALTFETALALVNERGLAMHRAAALAQGAMAAVLGLAADALRDAVATTVARGGGRVQLANFNAPGQIVISGDAEAVRMAGELAMEAGAKRVVPLNVAGAWHSALMDPAKDEFAAHVQAATVTPPRFTVISNVDAQPYAEVEQIKTNLIRSVTDEVLWHDTAVAMVALKLDLIVEFGAQSILAPMFKRIAAAPKAITVSGAAAIERLREQIAPQAVS
ncbi:malonyl CoA-acyl carrier protein transacylase [Vulcanimicrobium alpinum]|uniref:Malonyl CoA-acyl carrier protein transacylase n=1 Tax=Vulcanimicrobium alpinum TaxID=3016050 RepID=A0AAN1XXB4_UNVUL|nr:ACP S-malonyltransferase [Vulcanimicrobium alpinum]BDE06655.1 malonyl CoA-acyl carrier protein transacylase [Vulcanimicrobium alpinum]